MKILLLFLLLFTLYGCGSRSYTITFETGNEVEVVPVEAKRNENARLPIPVHAELHFVGWFTDEAFTNSVFRSTDVNRDTTLYAKWVAPQTLPYGSYLDRHNPVVAMDIEGYGTIIIELFEEVAPNTVRNFIYLVENGYYDGLSFHRVIESFVIQSGNGPTTECNIRGEFLANGVINPLAHRRGVISMARVGSLYNSASTQFFIMHDTVQHLNHNYAGFGGMVHGFDVLDAIASVPTQNDVPIEDIVITRARVDRKGITYNEPVCIN